MSALVRTLIVWLALLALPFQGFASAAMLPCASMPAAHHQRNHVLAGGQHNAMGEHAHHGGTPKHTHDHAKCGSCTACCASAAMAPPRAAGVFPHRAPATAVPFHAAHVPSVDLDLPERPPRTLRA
jgi:Protein of unknown function (DUF2946)